MVQPGPLYDHFWYLRFVSFTTNNPAVASWNTCVSMFLNTLLAEEIRDDKEMYILHFGAYDLIVWKWSCINLHFKQQFTNIIWFSESSLTLIVSNYMNCYQSNWLNMTSINVWFAFL